MPDVRTIDFERARAIDPKLMSGPTTVHVNQSAPVMEVFASFQGEGLYAGEPQVLVRLRGCPLRCPWCDTPGSWRIPEEDRKSVV